MTKIETGKKVTVVDAPAGFKNLIGSKVTAAGDIGVSGESQIFMLTSGGGLFMGGDTGFTVTPEPA